jgi:hypothetical protein|tara:strand:+ start:117 stop:461 length:345 start_codon:yes stop_codon:yes gene_type:complete
MSKSREKMIVSAIGEGHTLIEATHNAISEGISAESPLVAADAYVRDGVYMVTLDFEVDFKWLDEGYTLGDIIDDIYVEEDEANEKSDEMRGKLRIVGSLDALIAGFETGKGDDE